MKLYYHPVSTTSLMIMQFAAEEGVELDYQLVDLMKGEERRPEYLAINPNGLVPVLEDDGFVLTESGAILRYLAGRTGSAAYPADLQAHAHVDELMEWFYSNFYKDFGYGLCYPQLFPHHRRPGEAQAVTVEWGRDKARHWLGILDNNLLGPGPRFLGGERPNLADYVGAEMVNLGSLVHCTYHDFPNVCRWFGNMKALPSWSRVHEVSDGFAASLGDKAFVSI